MVDLGKIMGRKGPKVLGYKDILMNEKAEEAIMPTMPTTATKTEEVTIAETEDDKNYLDKLVKTIKPVSEEEEERRIRGAQGATTVAHLGNMLGALGNVIYTGKGAPSQQTAKVQAPNISAYADKVRQQRLAHEDRLMKMDAWKQEVENNKWKRDMTEKEYELNKGKMELEAKKSQLELMYKQGLIDEQKYDNEIKRLQMLYEPKKQQAELGKINAQKTSYESNAKASNARAGYYDRGGASGDDTYHFDMGGRTVSVPKSAWNDVTKAEALRLAGSDGYVDKDIYGNKRAMTDAEAVRFILNSGTPEAIDYIMRLGNAPKTNSNVVKFTPDEEEDVVEDFE